MQDVTERLPYSVAGWRLPPILVWALESKIWQVPARSGVGELLRDWKRNNLGLYGYEHMVGASDALVHEHERPDHLVRALASAATLEWEPSAAIVIGRNSYDAPLLLEYSAPAVRVLYLRELEGGAQIWVSLGRPEDLFAALWPEDSGPPERWVATGPSPRRWSVRGFALPPGLSRMLGTGRWRSTDSLRVLTLEQMYARRVELDANRELRDLLVIAQIGDSEVALDYAATDRQSSDAAPCVVMKSRAIADDFTSWAADHWPADASDAAREAPLFARPEVPLRTAPHLWMPGVDPD